MNHLVQVLHPPTRRRRPSGGNSFLSGPSCRGLGLGWVASAVWLGRGNALVRWAARGEDVWWDGQATFVAAVETEGRTQTIVVVGAANSAAVLLLGLPTGL